jgi:ribosomal protein L24E
MEKGQGIYHVKYDGNALLAISQSVLVREAKSNICT